MATAREKIVNVRKDSIVPFRDEMLLKNKNKLNYTPIEIDLEYKDHRKRDNSNYIYLLIFAYLIIALMLFFGGN